MTPNPENVIIDRNIPSEISQGMSGDEVVISGIAGLFPKSDTVLELKENLYNQIDMVNEINYDTIKHPNLPKHLGKINNLNKFDAQFFRVTHWQADSLDPLSRKLMECAFSAIYDSGINPVSLSGTKLGVFIGSSYSDVVQANLYDSLSKNKFIICGSNKTMLANRISYWINSNAPSLIIDQGCASSMACLELAYNSIKRGDCEAALVGGCNVCIHPGLSLNLKNAGHLCSDGKTKCFDKKGDGYVRSEAINLLFLQKAKDAKRIYTEIYHVKGKFFTEPDNFLGVRKAEDIEKFLHEFYSEIPVSPTEVEYVEACGLGIAEADGNELDAIGRHFGKTNPVKVGCIKSNMGHSEAASSVCAITKICLAYIEGKLPGNLHYNDPLENIPSVRDGRIQVVTRTTTFNRGFTAVNCFSYTGANYHCLFKGHYKVKEKRNYLSSIPRLILLSGREEHGLNKVMDVLSSHSIDPEQIALLHNIYKTKISSLTGLSYILLDTDENQKTVCLARSFQLHSGTSRPVWFLYSGMGSQWCGMGTELLRIPIFAAAVERCRVVLEPLGVDILKIITVMDKSAFDNNIMYSMLAITVMQIGLTDILKAIGIVPNNYIGHSLGEVGCAYCDGSLTAEEAILLSYYRGIVSIENPLIRGSMAAVGLGHKEILPLCPPEIDVGCHNSENSSTISGPIDAINQFISDLVSRGIFAKEVPCSNIAYHSRYVLDIAPKMLEKLKKLIKVPKLRSQKWISTVFLREDWGYDSAKYASAEYFTHSLSKPVFFEENATLIPNDAIVIEIAPHGLLQAIIRKSHRECAHVTVTKRDCTNPINFLLEAVGKLHQLGLNPQIEVLYPKVEFPVSTDTPLLSHLVEWEHSTDWPEVTFKKKPIKMTSSREVTISLHDDDYNFIKGYARNGVDEFPESALLVLVWETLGMNKGKNYSHLSVTFYDVTFHNRLEIEIEDVTRLRITIENATERFEIINKTHLIVSGFVKLVDNVIISQQKDFEVIINDTNLNGNVLYNILSMKGYSYSEEFQCIHSINPQNNAAYIKWTGKWVAFLDSLLQVCSYSRNYDGVSKPKIINNLSIQVDEHRKAKTKVLDNMICYKSELLSANHIIRCGGVQIDGIIFEDKIKINRLPDVILTRKFVPDSPGEIIDLRTAVFINMQLVANNVEENTSIVTEIVTSNSKSIINTIEEAAEKSPTHNYDVKSINIDNELLDEVEVSATSLFIAYHLPTDGNALLRILTKLVKEGAFVLTLEENIENMGKELNFKIITRIPVDNNNILVLLKETNYCDKKDVVYIAIDQYNKFSWSRHVLTELDKRKLVVIVSEIQPAYGLLGFVNRVRQDKQNKIGLVIVDDDNILLFNPENDFYKQQLQKNLVVNVYKKGQWGNYYYIPSDDRESLTSIDVCLTSTTFNDFDSLTWIERPQNCGNFIKVSYAGPSSRDCLKAIGKDIDKSSFFGMDFSGTDSNGDRVMGLVRDGAIGTIVETDLDLMWPVPKQWSLEDAATVPLPYVYAYYCLIIKEQVKRNQTILVTNGSEALGQAVISICLSLNVIVFVSVNNESKKRFLLKLFPALKDENVICYGYEALVGEVKKLTKNQRCDIVINSSSGYSREAAMKCVAFLGRFLDLSEIDMLENKNFEMFYLKDARTYKTVNISSIFKSNNYKERKVLRKLITDGIVTGAVRPLSRVVFSPVDISRAFQLIDSRRHRGRVLVKMDALKTSPSNLDVISSLSFSKSAHIVVCDKGALGVNLIENLVNKGANYIVVHLRANNEYLLHKIKYWKNDVKIEINLENLQTIDGCNKLLNTAKRLGLVKSIFIIHDYEEKAFKENPEEDFRSGCLETFMVTANLDTISRNVNSLSNFVVIYTCSQSCNNEYATSACDKICEDRRNIGLPGLLLRTMTSNKITQEISNQLPNLEVMSSLFHTLDKSLKMNYENVLLYNLKKKNANILTIERILGLSDINNTRYNLTLEEMNISDSKIEELRLNLRPIQCSSEELRKMTLLKLKQMWNKVKGSDISPKKGLGVFYNYLDTNEINAIELLVPMKTLLPNYEDNGYIDRSKNHLIMIPGFDGHNYTLATIAERLKIPTVTLQLGPDIIFDTIPDMAKYLANHIKLNFEIPSNFYVLGYSFGVNIALEVAKLLECEGRTGIVYCLDSSPDALKLQLAAYLGNLANGKLENMILEHMYYLMTGQKSIELKQDLLMSCDEEWSTKMKICLHHLREIVTYSYEFQKSVLESAYNRINLAKTYECDLKLKSELILIKGTSQLQVEGLNEDYNLSKYTNTSTRIFSIESDHASTPYNNKVSNIINKRLSLSVMQDFERENLCEFYNTD